MRVFSHFGWDKHVKHSLGSSGCVEWVPGSFFNTTLCRTGTKTGARKHCLCNKTILHIWTTTFDIAFIFVDHVDTKYMCRFYRSLQRIKKHIFEKHFQPLKGLFKHDPLDPLLIQVPIAEWNSTFGWSSVSGICGSWQVWKWVEDGWWCLNDPLVSA